MEKIMESLEAATTLGKNSGLTVIWMVISFLLLWSVVLVIYFKARLISQGGGIAITPEYEPPVGVGPVYAHYLLTSGRTGGMVGDVSISGAQMLAFIELYEKKLFQTFAIRQSSVVYEIARDYRTQRDVTAEEIKLLELMEKKVGSSGALHFFSGKNGPDEEGGYVEIQSVWYEFQEYLYSRSVEDGFVLKRKMGLYSLMRWFSTSLTFGVFFGIFVAIIPYIGIYISLLFILPVAIIFAVARVLAHAIIIMIPELINISPGYATLIFIFLFISWFAWFLIIGHAVPILNNIQTHKGREMVRRLRGYGTYLKTVDLDRLSFSFDYSDSRTVRTTFSWLVVFRIASDLHWDQWYQLVGTPR
jgi:hypothetical protein